MFCKNCGKYSPLRPSENIGSLAIYYSICENCDSIKEIEIEREKN